jgi:hypothetical protein
VYLWKEFKDTHYAENNEIAQLKNIPVFNIITLTMYKKQLYKWACHTYRPHSLHMFKYVTFKMLLYCTALVCYLGSYVLFNRSVDNDSIHVFLTDCSYKCTARNVRHVRMYTDIWLQEKVCYTNQAPKFLFTNTTIFLNVCTHQTVLGRSG